MKKISIFSEDKRFYYARELFIKNGYECSIGDLDSLSCADALILPVGQCDNKKELDLIFSLLNRDAAVFTGSKEKIKRLFGGRIYAYSENEAFLLRNAYITAQCAIRLTMEKTDSLILGKKALILGYGRIGKYLASMLKSLGADIFIYARKEKSIADAEMNGMKGIDLCDIPNLYPDMIYNTVPDTIIKRSLSDVLPKETLIVELASSPGGFEDKEIAMKAPALPGRMMPKSAGEAVFDLVSTVLSKGEEHI